MASLSQLQHKISHCSLLTLNQAYGLAMEKPAATLRHYLTSATRILRGEHEGLRQLEAAGRAVPRAAHQIPVYVGGVASRSLAVTSELADGSFVTQCTPQGLPEVREGLVKGAQRAGQALADIPIAPLVHCCVCPDRAVALRSVRRVLAFYGQVPLYNRFFARQGFAQEAEQIATTAPPEEIRRPPKSPSPRPWPSRWQR